MTMGNLIERLRDRAKYGYVSHSDRQLVADAANEIERLEKDLRTVQNAAKTLASAQGTELEHRRRNGDYDHRLRAEHQSLIDRDALMTEALEKAEAEIERLRAALASAEGSATTAAARLAAEEMRERAAKVLLEPRYTYSTFTLDTNGRRFVHHPSGETEFMTLSEVRRYVTQLGDAIRALPLPPSSSPEDQEKAKPAATPTIADPDGEARS